MAAAEGSPEDGLVPSRARHAIRGIGIHWPKSTKLGWLKPTGPLISASRLHIVSLNTCSLFVRTELDLPAVLRAYDLASERVGEDRP